MAKRAGYCFYPDMIVFVGVIGLPCSTVVAIGIFLGYVALRVVIIVFVNIPAGTFEVFYKIGL